MNKIKWVIFSVIASIVIIYSICYAEIQPVSIDDIKDHEKITAKLNRIIDAVNKERKDDRDDAKDLRKVIKYQLGVDDKIVKKMINKGWVSTHAEVEPSTGVNP